MRASILTCLFFFGVTALAKPAPRPTTEPPPKADEAVVKMLVASSSTSAGIDWVKKEKATFEERHVFYFDTPDLTLNKAGISLVVRRLQDDTYTSTVGVRSAEIKEIPIVKGKARKGLKCFSEKIVGATPAIDCEMSKKEKKVLSSVDGDGIERYFSSDQKKFAKHFVEKIEWSKLKVYGPINEAQWSLETGGFTVGLWALTTHMRLLEVEKRVPIADLEKTETELREQFKKWGLASEENKSKVDTALTSLRETKPLN